MRMGVSRCLSRLEDLNELGRGHVVWQGRISEVGGVEYGVWLKKSGPNKYIRCGN